MIECHRDLKLPGYGLGFSNRENPFSRAFELITENRMAAASAEEGSYSNLSTATSSLEGEQQHPTEVESQAFNGSVELYSAGE